MDRSRYEQLKEKRFRDGLSDEEADELGRMMAEEMGEAYANAEDLGPDTEALDQPDITTSVMSKKRRDVYDDDGRLARERLADEERQKDGADPSRVVEHRDTEPTYER